MRWKVHVRFGEEKQRNSSTTLCLLLYTIVFLAVYGVLFCVVWTAIQAKAMNIVEYGLSAGSAYIKARCSLKY